MVQVLVLGLGMQGKAVVHDLERSPRVDGIVVADANAEAARAHLESGRCVKSRAVRLDAANESELSELFRELVPNLVICMLPADFNYPVARAAVAAGCPFVSSSYTGRVVELDQEARAKNLQLLPEMGMDPGIDLILGRLAVDELDIVHGLRSYGAGLPEPACSRDNPLRYKITWTFDGVLKAYKRPARLLVAGREVVIPGTAIFRPEHGHTIEIPGLGPLEAYPNGDAIHYIRAFDLGPELRDMGRFAFRYPGHCRFWSVLAELGFLEDEPLSFEGCEVTPRQFLVRHLTPQLQFADRERDMVVLRVEAWGLQDGRRRRVSYQLVDYRDLDTGLFAMNRTVGYTASIGALMILDGRISRPGVLSPTRDVPPRDFLQELETRGMEIDRQIEEAEAV